MSQPLSLTQMLITAGRDRNKYKVPSGVTRTRPGRQLGRVAPARRYPSGEYKVVITAVTHRVAAISAYSAASE